MMTATLAFALQGICVAASEAATGDSSHYYLDFAFHHPGGTHSHVITHRHADGAVHRHAVDDDDGALADHVKQPGWNMALVICVVCQRECGGSIRASHLERYDRNEPAERCSEALALEKIAPRYPGDPSPERILGKPGERMLTNGWVTPAHVLSQAQLIILGASTGI